MYTVTGRIKAIQQPKGGYLPASSFIAKQYDDGRILNPKENIHGSFVGMTVDYLTRCYVTKNLLESFDISLRGAKILNNYIDNAFEYALMLLTDVAIGNIASAVKLTAFDAVYRAGIIDISFPEPDAATVENIKIMVQRAA